MNQIKYTFLLLVFISFSCNEKKETVNPIIRNITESIYASGNIETENQYQVFSNINGIISKILVEEGQKVKIGSPLLQISNNSSKIQVETAELTSKNASLENNKNKLEELKLNLKSAKLKWRNDSLMFTRKSLLYKNNAITKIELESSELNYQNSQSNYKSAILQYEDLLKQIKFNAKITKNNAEQTVSNNNDFTIKSEIDGVIYSILKKKGEFITPQLPLATIGSHNNFILKLQVDEYDIVKLKKGQIAKIGLNSYKGQTFDASITKIYPIMNERSKTFLVDAKFTEIPPRLYPNLSVEANIIIKEKMNALTLPKSYVTKNNYVTLENGTKKKVRTGLKNYEYVEILSGITKNDKIILSNEI
ncbi:MAG: efflux RND transporter periplasmic adaptor subunit [Crocinitomicaceae bacterium]